MRARAGFSSCFFAKLVFRPPADS
ncbi:rCG59187, isoform CRA_b [Rattus norvegicus]|uniref:RCG59187, isoform CRA_b n=1 Tax=Rattus norvegicus TaxID=10116 RepID=A6KIU9_RAT|nr:rCG59187, isoform CRA_b [Rattus norvegicus]